jgi:uncharacterized FlaG/YvyC family protein
MAVVHGATSLDAVIKNVSAASAPKAAQVQRYAPDPVGANASAQSPQMQDTIAAVREAAKKLSQELRENNNKVAVKVDKTTNRMIVSLKDPKSGKVVQQLPPEGILKMLRQISVATKGRLLNSVG